MVSPPPPGRAKPRRRRYDGEKKDFPDLRDNFVASQRNLDAGRWWTLMSSAVSHQRLPHLLGNMLAFHAFMTIGPCYAGLSAIDLAAVGACSAVSCSALQLWDNQRKGRWGDALGASGLVSGLGAYVTVKAPMLRVSLLIFPVPVPLFLIEGACLAWDVYNTNNVESTVGHAGHIGGTACGVVLGLARRAWRCFGFRVFSGDGIHSHAGWLPRSCL